MAKTKLRSATAGAVIEDLDGVDDIRRGWQRVLLARPITRIDETQFVRPKLAMARATMPIFSPELRLDENDPGRRRELCRSLGWHGVNELLFAAFQRPLPHSAAKMKFGKIAALANL